MYHCDRHLILMTLHIVGLLRLPAPVYSKPHLSESSQVTAAVGHSRNSTQPHNERPLLANVEGPSQDQEPLPPLWQLTPEMQQAAFKEMSKLAFKSLAHSNYEDPYLPTTSRNESEHSGSASGRSEKKRRCKKRHCRHRSPKYKEQKRVYTLMMKEILEPQECFAHALKQRVRVRGCVAQIFVNQFCYGQCNSFFVPRLSTERMRPSFQSTPGCKPDSYEYVALTLNCPWRAEKTLVKKVLKVNSCSCTARKRL